MYRKRLVCAVCAQMNIISRQTTVCLGEVKGGFSNETFDVHRSCMSVRLPAIMKQAGQRFRGWITSILAYEKSL
jgi:hypothetical protein